MLIVDTMEPESTGKKLNGLGQEIITLSLPAGDIVIPRKEGRGKVTAEWAARVVNMPLSMLADWVGVTMLEAIKEPKRLLAKYWADPNNHAELKASMGNWMVVERKTPQDLLHSIEDGRLVDQCRRMVDWSWLPVVLIDGRLGEEKGMVTADGSVTGWGMKSVEMLLLSLMAGGVSVVGGRGVELSEVVGWLMGWMDKEEHLLPGKRAVIPFIEPTVEMSVLTSFSGIGPDTARSILEYCGSLRNAFMFMTDEGNVKLKGRPKGVGKQRIAEFRRAMGLEEGEVMMPVREDEG